MKYKKEITISIFITIIVFFLKFINVLQVENGFGELIPMLLLIMIGSFLTTVIQNNIDQNHEEKKFYYQNLDILKYVCAILIVLCHLRPFQNISDELDLTFNNIITRACVPMFFLISGYFVAKKENKNPGYIKQYIKNMIPTYLVWSAIYFPILIMTALDNLPLINSYISSVQLPIYLFVPLLILLFPIVIIVTLTYSGVYYHLWYFPALIFSLLTLGKWKKHFSIKVLLGISFVLLLFGATETYYGVLPLTIKQLISYYYSIFFTTRNFLFFGLFYVVLGYDMGKKEEIHSKYCFLKLILSFLCLIMEAIFLHDTVRLNSNILLSCIPLSYYLFICTIYLTNHAKGKFPFRDLSKYYYLIHPMMIFIVLSWNIKAHPYISIICVLISTHLLSKWMIQIKKNHKNYPI